MTSPKDASGASGAWRVAVFGSSVAPPGGEDYELARRLGRRLAEEGFEVWNGGYLGTMEATARGVQEAAGQCVGVTIEAWDRYHPGNAWLSRKVPTPDLHERLRRLTDVDAAVAVHGGIGTLTEVALFWSKVQLEQLASSAAAARLAMLEQGGEEVTAESLARQIGAMQQHSDHQPLILIGARWASLVSVLADTLAISDSDRKLVTIADTVEDCIGALRRLLPASRTS